MLLGVASLDWLNAATSSHLSTWSSKTIGGFEGWNDSMKLESKELKQVESTCIERSPYYPPRNPFFIAEMGCNDHYAYLNFIMCIVFYYEDGDKICYPSQQRVRSLTSHRLIILGPKYLYSISRLLSAWTNEEVLFALINRR